jgi:hypothetical protein
MLVCIWPRSKSGKLALNVPAPLWEADALNATLAAAGFDMLLETGLAMAFAFIEN